jgi:hypothetical protein
MGIQWIRQLKWTLEVLSFMLFMIHVKKLRRDENIM